MWDTCYNIILGLQICFIVAQIYSIKSISMRDILAEKLYIYSYYCIIVESCEVKKCCCFVTFEPLLQKIIWIHYLTLLLHIAQNIQYIVFCVIFILSQQGVFPIHFEREGWEVLSCLQSATSPLDVTTTYKCTVQKLALIMCRINRA